ncbi:MAG: baseplate J/ family protein [Anaerosolibacter sp.]|jgi:uncharacterized phage protein gp47/JayE|uniref:baseplate J/gp47 family protein n=1 Tax=Anaerosolibacter sp. TaxID=1872527 RepID=UPI00260E9C8C|nr:baseplate J/gp47 family protein [Anaerosolibacter sp.]MDF2546153.1 baseplate J/ family protein [Anaerosolibacter sp.]
MADDRTVIQNRMLVNIPDEYDKSEGEFFYDNTKAVAIELEGAYQDQEAISDRGFVETATGEWLDKKVAEQGLVRKPATKATCTVTITGSQGAAVNTGIMVASDAVNFIVKESKVIDATGIVNVLVECEEYGSIGNVPVGAIKYFPVTIAGLSTVTNPAAAFNGYDGETDEELRVRYFEKVRTPATSGNKYHYRNWAKEVVGVGDARVFPLANGPGTVKVVIIDSNKTGAEPELVTDVFNHIEEVRPIGATVEVVSATEVPINVSATLIIDADNYIMNQVIANIEGKLAEYFKVIAFNATITYVSHAVIGSIILDTDGVLDYSNLTINGEAANIPITDVQVVVLGVVTNV